MLDPKILRHQIDEVTVQLAKRGFVLDKSHLEVLELRRKELQGATQALQAQRNQASKKIGEAKARGEDVDVILQQVAQWGDDLKQKEQELNALQQELLDFQLSIPNLLHESVPPGRSEAENVELRRFKEPTQFPFKPRDHVELGELNGELDFARAAKISGSRFSVLHGKLAALQRALAEFMLDVHIQQHGYHEVYVPYIVLDKCFFGTGQLPKFREDQFAVAGDLGLSLIPTAEVPITNLYREEIIEDHQMPIKHVGQTPCFRSEAGSYGKDTRGLIRQHQFQKVEMVQIVRPQDSFAALEDITKHAETILQQLELPYRVVALCAGDVGFSATKTYDIEVWLPGQNCYREISSCSNFGDFQARRMQLRWRNPETGKPEFAHTLNGSGLAVGRTLVAVMENYQTADGHIVIPEVLRPYLRSLEI